MHAKQQRSETVQSGARRRRGREGHGVPRRKRGPLATTRGKSGRFAGTRPASARRRVGRAPVHEIKLHRGRRSEQRHGDHREGEETRRRAHLRVIFMGRAGARRRSGGSRPIAVEQFPPAASHEPASRACSSASDRDAGAFSWPGNSVQRPPARAPPPLLRALGSAPAAACRPVSRARAWRRAWRTLRRRCCSRASTRSACRRRTVATGSDARSSARNCSRRRRRRRPSRRPSPRARPTRPRRRITRTGC